MRSVYYRKPHYFGIENYIQEYMNSRDRDTYIAFSGINIFMQGVMREDFPYQLFGALSFNADISSWDITALTNISDLFRNINPE